MNDERSIEKLLRRYAKKRRDDAGAPLELHAATRRMLQGEVARQYPRREAAGRGGAMGFAQLLKLWRRQLIWAVPAMIVLGAGLWALVGTNGKPDAGFGMAKTGPAPVIPAKAVAESFKALEADKSPLPAPPANLANPPALAFADRNVPREALESNSRTPTSLKDGFSVSLSEKTAFENRDKTAGFGDLAAASRIESERTLESGRLAAAELAQSLPLDETRGQTVVARRALTQPPITIDDEKTQTMGLALAAKARSDPPVGYYSARRNDVPEAQGRLADTPASRPAALAPDASGRFYRQEIRDGGEPGSTQVYSQTFANRAPARSHAKAATAGPGSSVLANFQVEQSGNQLRVIDGDGSTYLGELNLPAADTAVGGVMETKLGAQISAKSAEGSTRPQPAAMMRQQQSAQSILYRVSGTNRTFNQPVVFTWNFVELTNGLAAAQIRAPARDNLLPGNLPAQQFPFLLNNSRIAGRAQLGGAKEIEVNAVPVSP